MPPAAQAILLHFLAISDDQGQHEHSVPEIAAAVGIDVRRLQRWFGTLRRMHWIWQTYRKIGPKTNDTTVYTLRADGLYWNAQAAYHVQRGTTMRPPPRRLPQESRQERGGVVTDRPPDYSRSSSGLRPRPPSAALALGTGSAPALPAADRASTAPAALSKKRSREEGIEAGLDAIAPKSTFVPPLLQLRGALVDAGLGDLIGEGYEQRLQRIVVGRQLDANDVATLLRKIGERRKTGIFDAAGQPSPWTGPPRQVRGFVYRCFERERLPRPIEVTPPAPFVLREGPAAPLRPRRVDAAAPRAHLDAVNAESLSRCGKRILEALLADYHGEKPMTPIATPDVAHRFAQASEEGCAGGKLTTEDVIAVIRHYATIRAFRMKRGELLLAGALESFVRKELREAKRGCAASLNEKIRAATFIPHRAKIETRQPGGLEHLLRDRPVVVVPVPPPLSAEEQAKQEAEKKAHEDERFAGYWTRIGYVKNAEGVWGPPPAPKENFTYVPCRFSPKEMRDQPVDEVLRVMLKDPRAYHSQELAAVREDFRRQRQHHLWNKAAADFAAEKAAASAAKETT